jgi:hypothetical protein
MTASRSSTPITKKIDPPTLTPLLPEPAINTTAPIRSSNRGKMSFDLT